MKRWDAVIIIVLVWYWSQFHPCFLVFINVASENWAEPKALHFNMIMRVSAKIQVYFLFWLSSWSRGGSKKSENYKKRKQTAWLDSIWLTSFPWLFFLCLPHPFKQGKRSWKRGCRLGFIWRYLWRSSMNSTKPTRLCHGVNWNTLR